MNILLRNFFYAIGITVLLYLMQVNPETVTFADLVRLVQSTRAHSVVELLTVILVAFDMVVSLAGPVCVCTPTSGKVRNSDRKGLTPPEPAAGTSA
jgi:hypothetical protein